MRVLLLHLVYIEPHFENCRPLHMKMSKMWYPEGGALGEGEVVFLSLKSA